MAEFPNPATQFKPGQPGGPGVPKGTKHLSTWIRKLMEDENFETVLEDSMGKKINYKGAPVEAIVKTAIVKANKNDDKAREWLAKYGYGTKLTVDAPDGFFGVPQHLQVTIVNPELTFDDPKTQPDAESSPTTT